MTSKCPNTVKIGGKLGLQGGDLTDKVLQTRNATKLFMMGSCWKAQVSHSLYFKTEVLSQYKKMAESSMAQDCFNKNAATFPCERQGHRAGWEPGPEGCSSLLAVASAYCAMHCLCGHRGDAAPSQVSSLKTHVSAILYRNKPSPSTGRSWMALAAGQL